MKSLLVLVFLVFVLSQADIYSQSPNSSQSQKKIALLIGNGNYNSSILANPENDAKAMKSALQSVGFTVLEYENLTQSQMKKAIDEFGDKLKSYDVGLFFYAGHGIQAKGYNYLIPIDAELKSEQQVEYDCVQADRILALMEASGSKVNIIILDACRNNPFERSWTRSESGKGLAFMNAPSGTLIAYATSPGSTASDGSGKNGLYTSAILESIQIPNISIIQMFQNVRGIVSQKSSKKQIPWESTSLIGDFYFSRDSTNKVSSLYQNVITPVTAIDNDRENPSNSFSKNSTSDRLEIVEIIRKPVPQKANNQPALNDTVLYAIINQGLNKKIRKGAYLEIYAPKTSKSTIQSSNLTAGTIKIGSINVVSSFDNSSEGKLVFNKSFENPRSIDTKLISLKIKRFWTTAYGIYRIGPKKGETSNSMSDVEYSIKNGMGFGIMLYNKWGGYVDVGTVGGAFGNDIAISLGIVRKLFNNTVLRFGPALTPISDFLLADIDLGGVTRIGSISLFYGGYVNGLGGAGISLGAGFNF